MQPYVSTAATLAGAPAGESQSLMRFTCNGYSNWQAVAGKFANAPHAAVAQASMGIPRDPQVYRNALQAYASTCVETSMFFNAFDVFDVPRFMRHFGVTAVPPFFESRRGMLQETVWELGRVMAAGPENNRHTVFGVHCTAALVVASLFGANAEGRFHANMPSNAARNVLQAVCSHAARAGLSGDGNTVHLKNFAYAPSGPRPTHLHVTVPGEPVARPGEYFLRPKYDMRMQKSGVLGLLPGRFRAFPFEVRPPPLMSPSMFPRPPDAPAPRTPRTCTASSPSCAS